jgi:hypothetical protein
MGKSNQERQQQWQARQRGRGHRRYTVMLDGDAANILEKVRKRTGETLTHLFNRVVRQLGGVVSGNDYIAGGGRLAAFVSDNECEVDKEVGEQIVNWIGVVGLTEAAVAERLNAAGVPASEGTRRWQAEGVAQLYRELVAAS